MIPHDKLTLRMWHLQSLPRPSYEARSELRAIIRRKRQIAGGLGSVSLLLIFAIGHFGNIFGSQVKLDTGTLAFIGAIVLGIAGTAYGITSSRRAILIAIGAVFFCLAISLLGQFTRAEL